MKKFCIMVLFFIFIQAVCPGDEKTDNYYPYQVGKYFVDKLPNGWKCIFNFDSVIFLYDGKVDTIGFISLSGLPSHELAKEMGVNVDCYIVLKFVRRFSDEEYNELVSAQKKALQRIKIIISKAKGSNKSSKTKEMKDKYPLPKYYNNEYSVYFHQTLSENMKAYPEEVEKQSQDITAEIEKILKKYPEAPDEVLKESQPEVQPEKENKPVSDKAKDEGRSNE